MSTEHPGTPAHRLIRLVLLANVALLAAHVIIYVLTGSQLVLAQGADSLLDLAAGFILLWTASVGMQPRDANHPFGHHRAEPIGALIAAVLSGVLAFEVGRSAVTALLQEAAAPTDIAITVVLAVKCGVKVTLLAAIRRILRRHASPALAATFVDTRNDVLATASSLLGAALARAGVSWADAGLALPVALYIGYAGWQLAQENLRYLMGEAPSDETYQQLRERAAAVPGVERVRRIRAHFVGQALHAEIVVLVKGRLSATESHDLELAVKLEVEQHPLVAEAFIHCDTADGRSHEDRGEER